MKPKFEDARPPGGLRRIAGPALGVLAQALLLLAGLATAVLGFGWFVGGYHAVGAHRHAPPCGTAAIAPGTDCVLHEGGRVTAKEVKHGEDASTYLLTVARETGPERDYTVDKGFYKDAKVGTTVDLTIFRGRVAELSYEGHRSENPVTPWLTGFKVALLVGLGSGLTAQGVVWRRCGPRSAPAFFAVFVSFFSVFGSLILMSLQWPLAITLAPPVLGWLLLTAAATAVEWDD